MTRTFSACCLFAFSVGWFPGCASQTDLANEAGGASGGSANSKGTDSTSSADASGKTGGALGTTTESNRDTVNAGGHSSLGGSGSTSSVGSTIPLGGTDVAMNTKGNASGTGSALANTGGRASATGGSSASTTGTTASEGGTTATSATAQDSPCASYATKPTQTGTLFEGSTEVSGIVASRKQPGVLWIHGDSGAILFAIDSTGKLLGQWELTADVRFFWIYNWEDISIQSMQDGPDRIWVGDIGNHTADAEGNPVEPREDLRLLSIDEPTIDPAQAITGTVQIIDDLHFAYPDGLFDAEAMMIDPLTGDAYVISKVQESPSKIYRIQAPLAGGALEQVGSLDAARITAGDFSPSGRELVVRDYMYVYCWALPTGKSWREILGSEPSTPDKRSRLQYNQNYFAEAIGFSADETGFYVVSEEQQGAAPSPVEFYPKNCN